MSISSPQDRPRLALIAGPTASGKSARALELAERENGTIINADASQVYRDLRILTARPSEADEARAPHRLFGHRDGADPCSAAEWAEEAKAAIAEVQATGRLPILVGGTGLYLRTLLDGIAPVPEIDPAIRATVRGMTASDAFVALQHEDAGMAARLHPNDTARLQRALEVVRSTGRTLADWRAERVGGIRAEVTLDVTLILPPVPELYQRCDERVMWMMAHGAVLEVQALLARRLDPQLPVMRAIGVGPLAEYINGMVAMDDAVAQVQQATRNYAKRQLTWLRHQELEPQVVD